MTVDFLKARYVGNVQIAAVLTLVYQIKRSTCSFKYYMLVCNLGHKKKRGYYSQEKNGLRSIL